MRRLVLVVFAIAFMFTTDPHSTKALPSTGVARYYYENACSPLCRLASDGRPGMYLGERIDDCYNHIHEFSETSLVGLDNWKQEFVYDCSTGSVTQSWYHGGYQHWTQSTPTSYPDCGVYYC